MSYKGYHKQIHFLSQFDQEDKNNDINILIQFYSVNMHYGKLYIPLRPFQYVSMRSCWSLLDLLENIVCCEHIANMPLMAFCMCWTLLGGDYCVTDVMGDNIGGLCMCIYITIRMSFMEMVTINSN